MATSLSTRAPRQHHSRLNLRAGYSRHRVHGVASSAKPCFDAYSRKQELGQQWQREMNYKREDNARQLQKRKAEIEKAVEHHLFSRASFFSDSSQAGQSMDALAQAVSLQSQLHEAVEKEDFALAASLRDQLKVAKAKTQTPTEASEQEKLRYALGQRVLVQDKTLKEPLPGVVFGWDKCCAENAEWKDLNKISSLQNGEKQPFYHVIIDNYAWADAKWTTRMIPCAYIPQENLSAPADDGSTWKQQYTGKPLADFTHPYSYALFLGEDNAGDFVPVPELRNLYGVARKDVYPPEDGAGSGDSPENMPGNKL